MIRPAKPSDMEELLSMGRAFFEESPFGTLATFDQDSLQLTMSAFITGAISGSLLVAVDDGKLVGMAAALIFPFYCNMNVKIAQENFWYCKPDYRSGFGAALMDELEADAKRKGADIFINACLAGNRAAALDRVYRKRGYTPCENSYIRKLAS